MGRSARVIFTCQVPEDFDYERYDLIAGSDEICPEDTPYAFETVVDWEDTITLAELMKAYNEFFSKCQAAGLQPEIGITATYW